MPLDNWQKNTKNFKKIKYGSPSLEWTKGLDHRLHIVQKHVNFKGKKILDVGCGIGMFLERFKILGAKPFGIDIDKAKIREAQKSFPHTQLAASEKLPFCKGTFDIIWLHEVIEHVSDDRKTISECFRVLKPGGKLVIFAPNRLWPFETHGIFWKGKYYFGNIPFVTYLPNAIYNKLTPHVRNYLKKDLPKLIPDRSYKIVYYRGVFPGFDKLRSRIPIIGTFLQQISRIGEKTILHRVGISHLLILEKL